MLGGNLRTFLGVEIGPLLTRAKGRDHVIVRVLDSHLKVIPLIRLSDLHQAHFQQLMEH